MGTKKKKSGKPKKQPQFKGHYCKICGEHKANEKFSGKGHAAHICKACASKSSAEKSEDMTINRLHGMVFLEDDELDADDEPGQADNDGGDASDDRTPTWSVEIKYKNGMEQKTKGYDFMPDPVMELFNGFDGYFFVEDLDNGFDEDDIDGDDDSERQAEDGQC